MIEVHQLSKNYGLTRALTGISFSVARGDVLGFLGPNGAGKSTTMKILTGFLLPSAGRATIDGLDVVHESLEVRRKIGYLPESTPLYTEMRVDDYLAFVGEIRGLPRAQLKDAIAHVVDVCGLDRVVGKNILELSKGYRQRVGLAQALIHDPDVLILDEPTSGLDPNQIIEIRSLIERIGEDHTVVLSTHYLQEVEKSCNRIIIISQGEIVADDTQDALVSSLPSGPVLTRIKGPDDHIRSQLDELLPGSTVDRVEFEDEYGLYRIRGGSGRDASVEEALAHLVVKNGWSLAMLTRERPSLEDVFRNLTLEASRQAGDA